MSNLNSIVEDINLVKLIQFNYCNSNKTIPFTITKLQDKVQQEILDLDNLKM